MDPALKITYYLSKAILTSNTLCVPVASDVADKIMQVQYVKECCWQTGHSIH